MELNSLKYRSSDFNNSKKSSIIGIAYADTTIPDPNGK